MQFWKDGRNAKLWILNSLLWRQLYKIEKKLPSKHVKWWNWYLSNSSSNNIDMYSQMKWKLYFQRFIFHVRLEMIDFHLQPWINIKWCSQYLSQKATIYQVNIIWLSVQRKLLKFCYIPDLAYYLLQSWGCPHCPSQWNYSYQRKESFKQQFIWGI